jgi:ubiquinone/menaquinone biosynthesis C-methylase UbiE
MADEAKLTGEANGILWGERAADWAALQEGRCRPVYEAVFDRLGVGAGTAYLDAGCGAGMAAQIAASHEAHVSGCDASDALLAIARRRVPAGNFHRSDLEQMPFADGSFDVVTGFNSFQYAAHPGRALAEGRRVSRPGATIVIMTWGRPEGMPAAALVAALRPLLPPPPPSAPGPFALSEESALRAFAGSAGLAPEDVFDVESPWHYTDLATAIRALGSSGIAARARQASGSEAVDRAHSDALAPFRQADSSYRIPATFRCLIARSGRA